MGRGNKRNQKKQAASNNNAANPQISEEDKKLLEWAKQAKHDAEPELEEYKNMILEDLQKKANDEIAQYKTREKEDFEKKLKEEQKDLIEQNEQLKSENKKLQDDNKRAQEDLEKADSKKQKIVDDAQASADKITKDAETAAQDAAKKAQDEIAAEKESVEKEKEKLEDREMAVEAREALLKGKEKRLDSRAAAYEDSNPEAVAALEKQLQLCHEQYDSLFDQYKEISNQLTQIRMSQAKIDGVSIEDLQKTNEALEEKVEELTNKCNRYSDYELSEMKRALDQEKERITQIRNLEGEVTERKAELSRLQNAQAEYEQLKEQLDLTRTLNDHLRNELDNTKRMLESSVGEICPALTSIDLEESDESGESYQNYRARMEHGTDEVEDLPHLVEQVKTYAASRDKPLFYSDRDLRAYIAGLASSHLSILQGMSGTGKTSLPKIFAEATMGEINIVPVESSWRDRNELLGYYNDFSKKFTAKEFTCDLYRAGCARYSDTPYFIVLDEMNLSRVEYYFADFLSILEDKTENWRIKLVDTDMRQLPSEITPEVNKALQKEKSSEKDELLELVKRLYPEDKGLKLNETTEEKITGSQKQQLIAYLSNRKFKNSNNTRLLIGGPQNLVDGNTILIPQNVWFVGTANRDESTFEITDKVYDRAQVLNFNDRARGRHLEENVPKRYLTYDNLQKMFNKAIYENEKATEKGEGFRAEENSVLIEVEEILKANFRISYGNRIQDQMNTFVPVYIAAGITGRKTPEVVKKLENEAIDYQITNKVLRKLEYVEMNKDAGEKLKKIFHREGMKLAENFIDWKMLGEQ